MQNTTPQEHHDVSSLVHPVEKLSSDDKIRVMSLALRRTRKELRAERKKRIELKRSISVFIAVMLILVTGYVSINNWLMNNRARAEATVTPPPAAEITTAAVTPTKTDEGKDETNVTPNVLANYSVAPELPRALYINKLNVAARVKPMGLNSDTSIQTPTNIFDAGWYEGGAKPGEVGAVFIDGHASGPTRQGLFAYLDTLVKGDTLEIEKGNGSRIAYRVLQTETTNLKDVDMKKMLSPYGNTVRGLNLMTCTGTWIESEKTYDKRVVVYTEQI